MYKVDLFLYSIYKSTSEPTSMSEAGGQYASNVVFIAFDESDINIMNHCFQ